MQRKFIHSYNCIHPRTKLWPIMKPRALPQQLQLDHFWLTLTVLFIWTHFGTLSLPFPIPNLLPRYISPFRFHSHDRVLKSTPIMVSIPHPQSHSMFVLPLPPPLVTRIYNLRRSRLSLSLSLFHQAHLASLPCCPCWSFQFPNLPWVYILRFRFHTQALVLSAWFGSHVYALL